MDARQVAALYAAWMEADRRYRRRPTAGARQLAAEAEAAYLAARDWHRGRGLEEVAARVAALAPEERTTLRDKYTADLFGDDPRKPPQATYTARNLTLFGEG